MEWDIGVFWNGGKTPGGPLVFQVETAFSLYFFNFILFFYFYFILLYASVLVLPYIDMNPPQVYMSSQS